ncbi:D-amino acid dehydrogenase [Marinobacter sp. CHS3-4]|uniref:D-amino acid dehydrogenase n=1 Tax=Marinobacter sp. CHS3-4 TaxID=3045174 RepID=UPI0024B4C7FB|nr:D-amino acid dehydrogenase [Marinobacter sp. CHS3-4]MDI9244029.1 D-amino acid dehydrogenase [Marinobacter sp. CHS3-4]
MRVVVIGGGVVGVTTAYELNRRGHQVTVVERHGEPGRETSMGNAAQRSYAVVYPWADPAMIAKAIPWLLSPDGPLKMKMPPSLTTLRFLISTLRYAWSPGLFGLNKRAMVRLGMHSRTRFEALEADCSLNFDGGHRGLLHLASTPEAMEGYRKTQSLLNELGIPSRLLDSVEARESEPALSGASPLFGALSYDTDGTGDCHMFSQSLAAVCKERGVEFRCHSEAHHLIGDAQRIHAVSVRDRDGKSDTLEADAFVISAGCWSGELVRPFGMKLPIYPVKGYCLTAPLIDPNRAPVSTVMDDQLKVVSTRLGNRLRASGFVELSGFNREIPESRLATIRKSVQSRFPDCADLDAAETWTGFRPMTPDGPAVIGRGPRQNLYLNTAHGTFGWTMSLGSAHLIAQVMEDEQMDICLDPFRPTRFQE